MNEAHATLTENRQFQFLRCLGTGGFGEVFLALMVRPGGVSAKVAVKMLRADVNQQTNPVERLRDEGRLLGLLDHPVILRVTDLVELDGRLALVMQYVEGCDLQECIHGPSPIPLGPLLEVVGQVADALHHAGCATNPEGRALELVHRDIKPSNIRIGRHGEVKLLDFGIARANLPKRAAETGSGLLIGSRFYISPERFDEAAQASAPSDIFSLGCTLYEGLAREQLFAGLPLNNRLNASRSMRHLDEMLGRLAAHSGVRELVRGMLQFEPSARLSAEEVRQRCEVLASHHPPALRAWARNRPWPGPAELSTELLGRTFVEGAPPTGTVRLVSVPIDTAATLATVAPPNTGTLATGPVALAAGVVGLTGVATALVAVLVLAIVVALLWFSFGPGAHEEPLATGQEPPPLQPPGPSTEPLEPSSPVPQSPPPPTLVSEKGVSPTASTRPAPVVEPAAPSPPVIVTPAKTEVRGTDVVVELHAGGRAWSPGEVPPGEYQLWADFGDGPHQAGSIVVAEGKVLQLKCSKIKRTCWGTPP